MKLQRFALVVAIACCAVAQNAAGDFRRQAASDYEVAFLPGEDTQPSPSDLVPPAPLPDGDEGGFKATDNSGPVLGGGLGRFCNCSDEPWELFPKTCRGLKIGGWTQIGYHTEGTNDIGAGAFNNYPNVLQLHQAWLFAEKATDTGGCGWDWGFRLDYVYGTDGQDTQAFGARPGDWDEDWDAGGYYGHAIPQLYGEVAYNNLKVKFGHFFTPAGYEVVPAPKNFFYSHAMMMERMEPFTHTGVLAEWAMNDRTTVYGGWTRGWDSGFAYNGGSTLVGGLGYKLTDKLKMTYISFGGDFGYGTAGSDSNGYAHTLVFDWAVSERLTFVVQTDYIENRLAVARIQPGATTSTALGLNQYLLYKLNDCWAVGGRFEWIDIGDAEFTQATVGLNYRPHSNLLIRPELRFDGYEPGYTLRDSTVCGVDAILTF